MGPLPEDHRLSGREVRRTGQGRVPRVRDAVHPQQQLVVACPLLLRGAWRVSAVRHGCSALSSRVPYYPYMSIWYSHTQLSKWSVGTGGPELGHEQAEPRMATLDKRVLAVCLPTPAFPAENGGRRETGPTGTGSIAVGRAGTETVVGRLSTLTDSSWGARPAASGPGSGLGCFYLAVLGWGRCDQSVHQHPGIRRNLLHRPVEGCPVGSRWAGGAHDLANVLQGGSVDLLVRRRGLEVVEGSDAATHGSRG